jgi:hypothetical protein
LLPYEHELQQILSGFKGRLPQNMHKRGRPSTYSERLAVSCASEKLERDNTYVEIAEKYGLAHLTVKPFESMQNDTVRQLVKRGRKLIEQYIEQYTGG